MAELNPTILKAYGDMHEWDPEFLNRVIRHVLDMIQVCRTHSVPVQLPDGRTAWPGSGVKPSCEIITEEIYQDLEYAAETASRSNMLITKFRQETPQAEPIDFSESESEGEDDVDDTRQGSSCNHGTATRGRAVARIATSIRSRVGTQNSVGPRGRAGSRSKAEQDTGQKIKKAKKASFFSPCRLGQLTYFSPRRRTSKKKDIKKKDTKKEDTAQPGISNNPQISASLMLRSFLNPRSNFSDKHQISASPSHFSPLYEELDFVLAPMDSPRPPATGRKVPWRAVTHY